MAEREAAAAAWAAETATAAWEGEWGAAAAIVGVQVARAGLAGKEAAMAEGLS